MPRSPLMDEDGEVRELSEEDFATMRIGDPDVVEPLRPPIQARERAAFRQGLETALKIVARHKEPKNRGMNPGDTLENIERDLKNALDEPASEQA